MVLVFFLLAWIALVVILVVQPGIYDQTLKLPAAYHRAGELGLLVGLSAFLAVLSVGVMRGWRWTFWLVLIAFLAGLLRVLAAALAFAGVLPGPSRSWYLTFQAAVGLIQFAIGLLMAIGYRRAGVWGDA